MISLQYFDREDFPDLIDWSGDEAFLLQWAGPEFRYPLDEKQLEKYIAGANDIHHSNRFIYKAVDDTGTAVGHISIGNVDRVHRSARIGKVLVSPDAGRGKGIGTEMMKCILRIGFAELRLHRISLGVFDFNTPAMKCYEKVGFVQEGILRHARRYRDVYWNVVEMSILEDEWKESFGNNARAYQLQL
jgi:RimJ/RimL family protein N-acetyltransferase